MENKYRNWVQKADWIYMFVASLASDSLKYIGYGFFLRILYKEE